MTPRNEIIAGAGLADRTRKSRLPARLDFAQSASGLLLALFMWVHMLFVSSILVSRDFMYWITKMFEGKWLLGREYPALVGMAVAAVLALFVVHAFLALRKFPINYRQYRTFRGHMQSLHHEDTSLWWVQVYTGFAMFFLGSAHLFTMLTNPGNIGPYESADRIVSGGWWPIYILLLLAVELHGGVGLYRLCVKWGWFEGKDPQQSRARLRRAKWGLALFFLALGFATLAAYIRIGWEHRDRAGERYVPTWEQKRSSASAPPLPPAARREPGRRP